MPEFSVPWGNAQQTLRLPDDWTLQQIAQPALKPAGEDWPERFARALAAGGEGGLSRLLAARRSGRIVIIIEDMTRHSPLQQILPILLREIAHARIADEQVEIFFANGMHPPMTAQEVQDKIGPLAGQYRWRCNQWRDRTAHVSVGRASGVDFLVDKSVASADLRIIVSSVSPHLQAGFGGGYKMVFPGCAALETIRGIHRLGLNSRGRQLVGGDPDSNLMRRAIEAGGELMDKAGGRSLAVQYILDDHDLPSQVVVGDVGPTWRMMAKMASVACGVVVSQADVVVTNAWPRDFDLWQSFKAIANTRCAARPNGAIICLSRCSAGLNGMNPPKWPISPGAVRKVVRLLGPEALGSLVMRLAPKLAGDAAFFIRMAMQAIHRNPIYFVSPTLAQQAQRFPGLAIFATLEQAVEAARSHLGPGSQRVVVFPAGGVTYPIVEGRTGQG